MKLPKIKLGDIVHIERFLDHSTGNGEDLSGVIPFEAFGRIVRLDKDSFDLSYWGYVWIGEDTDVDHNTDIQSIVISTIKKMRVLK